MEKRGRSVEQGDCLVERMMDIFHYGQDRMDSGMAYRLSVGESKGVLGKDARLRVRASMKQVSDIVQGEEAVYGVNTGFGPLCSTRISVQEVHTLQDNLLRSHAVGVGEGLQRLLVRLMLILKVHALARGYSGVSEALLERLLWHIERDYTPFVPIQGSLGASGDLAPLAHMSLPLLGEGLLWDGHSYVETGVVLSKEGIKPLSLRAKEGIALLNGTQFMSAHAVYALHALHYALEAADIIGALSLEGYLGSTSPFFADLHALRPFSGVVHVAYRLQRLLSGSSMVDSHADCDRVQDPYSLRCMPQVHGATRMAWLHLKEITDCEVHSVTDNPILLGKKGVYSGGHFHGQPIALPLDYAGIAAAELGSISERRAYLLSHGGYRGLPKLLVKDVGLNSGLMMPHYSAAALVSENKLLAHPASTDSIPTSLGQEDHVSMGAWAGRKLLTIITHLHAILGIELLYATQALDFRRPLRSTLLLEGAHKWVRKHVTHIENDRIFFEDMKKTTALISSHSLVKEVNSVAKKHHIDLHQGEFSSLFRF